MADERLEKIWELQNVIHSRLRQNAIENYKKIGVSWEGIRLFHIVRTHPNITLGTLSELLSLSKSTVSSMVSRMEERGILIREVPKENRRIVHLRIAEDCSKRPEMIGMRKKMIQDQLGHLSEEDIEIVLAGLKKLEENITTEVHI